MSCKKTAAVIITTLLILVSACNLPMGINVTDSSNQDPAAVTAALQTRIAEIIGSTAAAETAFANALAETLTAIPSNTPEFTFTPSLTATSTLTVTPETPMISVSTETNCRTGPGTVYDWVGGLRVGETIEVVGRDSTGQYWVIRNPDVPGGTCWLWGGYATLTGNWSALPIIAAPPTPTPKPEFIIVSAGTTYEPLWIIWTIDVTVQNTGGTTWQSGQVVVHDKTSGADLSGVPMDKFQVPPGTFPTSEDLTPGESGGLYAAPLPYDPAGHHLKVTVTLCSQNGLAGTCVSKVTTFTP